MNQTPNTLENFKETDEHTEWDTLADADSPAKDEKLDITAIMDSVEVPDIDLPNDDTAETAANYTASNDEIYHATLDYLNRDVRVAENNGVSPESLQEVKSTRDLLIDAYTSTLIDAQAGENSSLVDELKKRQAICHQKVKIYSELGDDETANHNAKLSEYTTTLINHTNTIKKNIEDEKNPDSLHHQNANAFHSGPSGPDALSTDSIV